MLTFSSANEEQFSNEYTATIVSTAIATATAPTTNTMNIIITMTATMANMTSLRLWKIRSLWVSVHWHCFRRYIYAIAMVRPINFCAPEIDAFGMC